MNRTRTGSIGIAVVLVLVVGLGILLKEASRRFFYPKPSRMPAEIQKPMSEILTQLEIVLKTKAPHLLETLQPGLSAEQIATLERKGGFQVPEDIKTLYRWHNGVRTSSNGLISEFIPGQRFVPLEEALALRAVLNKQLGESTPLQRAQYKIFAGHRESWVYLFEDGAGDGYFYDPGRKANEGNIFYHFAESGDYVFFSSAKNLIAGISKCYEQGAFRIKEGPGAPVLDEASALSRKLWVEFGASNQP